MQPFTALAFATIIGGAPSTGQEGLTGTPDGETLRAAVTPAVSDEGCICDIEVATADLARITAALESMGASVKAADAELPLQGLTVNFGDTPVMEVIEKLRQLFGEDAPFDSVSYMFRFDPDPEAIPRLSVGDVSHARGMIWFFDENEGSQQLSSEQWEEFCAALKGMTTNGVRVFTEVQTEGASILAFLSPQAIPDRLTHITEAARHFPAAAA